jgi:hypothetical protein
MRILMTWKRLAIGGAALAGGLYGLFAAGAASCAESGSGRECRCEQCGEWLVSETAYFSVWSRLPRQQTVSLSNRCEELRRALVRRWLGTDAEPAWQPKCTVVIHRNVNEYVRACGANCAASAGCTTVTREQGRIVFRRIDLRGDAADWQTNALPHELTHVVLADRFPDRQLPPWFNEGLAMLSESPELRQRRLDVLQSALTSGSVPTLSSFLGDECCQLRAGDVDMRYALSLSLASFLDRQGESGQLVPFMEQVLRDGYDAALRKDYAMKGGLSELEQLWRNDLHTAHRADHSASR